MNASLDSLVHSIARLRGEPTYGSSPRGDQEEDRPFGLPSFEQVLEACGCPVLLISTRDEQPIAYATHAFVELTGHHIWELVGRSWTSIFDDPSGESRLQAFRGAIHGGVRTQGLLSAAGENGRRLDLEVKLTPVHGELGFVTHYVAAFHDITAERRRCEELEYRAYHDQLTGLANRHLLEDRFALAVAHAQRYQGSFSLVVVDLNGFKQINDRHGHDAGDALLQAVGTRLKAVVREEDTVARLGGDEFALLLTESQGCESAERALERIRDGFRQPIQLGAGETWVTCCAGVARFREDGLELKALLKAADVRLYKAKARYVSTSRGGCV